MEYELDPKDFSPIAAVVGVFLEYQGKFLSVLRNDPDYHGDRWGLPGGGVDAGETKLQAIVREVFEETGIRLPAKRFTHCLTMNVRHYGYDITYDVFYVRFRKEPCFQLNTEEHREARFVTPQEALVLPLVAGNDYCIQYRYNLIEESAARHRA